MNHHEKRIPVFLQTGFRVFFLGAAIYTVVSMAVWMMFYIHGRNIFVTMPLTMWHGHEMIFGFTLAVVAGFLLTAVMNWTGRPTPRGTPLALLFGLWLAARVSVFFPWEGARWLVLGFDGIFMTGLIIGVSRPIIAVRQWRQSAVILKVVLLLASFLWFHIALHQGIFAQERKALLLAVYLIVSLILTIGRRVIPFFVERGLDQPVTVGNSRFLDLSSLVLLVLFTFCDVFWPRWPVTPLLAGLLVMVHALRWKLWFSPAVLGKPLLWVLFAGYAFLIAGFALKVFAYFLWVPADAALHAFTAGGIGIFTLGMMARVSWGHTGRLIKEPPKSLGLMFLVLKLAAVLRVMGPLLDESRYLIWIAASQVLWMAAFVHFLVIYTPVLTGPRVDGKYG